MKVLILGAGGQLGTELRSVCSGLGDVVVAAARDQVDIADGARLRDVVRSQHPDIVFNAAAYTAVDRAESDPERAELINGRAVGRLAEVCRDLVVPVVHFSTDYVFDGNATQPIPEEAPTSPLNAYGLSKLHGEQALLKSGADAFVVRTSWVYGAAGPNFVRTVLKVTREKGEMSVVDDQRGAPTWARDLAVASRRLAEIGAPGVYHLTNSGECTWFEVASAVVELAGIDAEVHPIRTADYPAPAKRPAYSVLSNRRWAALGEPPLRPWLEALEGYLAELLAKA